MSTSQFVVLGGLGSTALMYYQSSGVADTKTYALSFVMGVAACGAILWAMPSMNTGGYVTPVIAGAVGGYIVSRLLGSVQMSPTM